VDCRLDDPADYRAYPFEFQHDWPSPDRFALPVVGAVSIDGRYLTAMASASSEFMFNGWGCWHNGANWEPSSGPAEARRWRVKIYVLENDVDTLLARVARDFTGRTR
jgi:hypothetical protein